MSIQLNLDNLKDVSYPSFAVETKSMGTVLYPTYGEALELYNTERGQDETARIILVIVNNSTASDVTEVGTLCQHNEGMR